LESFFFVGDIINEVGLGICGWGHQALGPNHKSHFWLRSF